MDKLTPDKLFDVNTTRKSQSIIVCNVTSKKVLERVGYNNVCVGGLPFAYIPKQHVKPFPESLLAFLPHSTEGEKITNFNQVAYFDYLESLRKDFSKIFVSLYWLDYNDDIFQALRRRGLFPVLGARPDDKNSLFRIRTMLEYCPYVTSNMIGSHILYALYAGCRVSLTEPLFDVRLDVQKSLMHHTDKEIDNLLYGSEIEYMREHFSWLMVNHPLDGIMDVDYGKKGVGEEWKLGSLQIRDVLGWNFADQLSGYCGGIARRIKRKINFV